MSDLPSREEVATWDGLIVETHRRIQDVLSILDAYVSGRLVDREAMTPMYRQGGLSGAWYPVVHGEPEPDGWLAIEDST